MSAKRYARNSVAVKASAQVLPLRPSSAPRQPDDEIILARPLPRIAPGIYQATTVRVTHGNAFDRRYVVAWFDVFDGLAEHGRVLARVPGYFRLPKARRLAPSSKLARWIQLLPPTRRDRLPLRTLEHKLWLGEIADCVEDQAQRDLAPAQHYSVVRTITERLA